MAEALYNKYRPQVFEDVVGQEHIERTLKNAIASDKISHAYMFTGPRGTGKTTTARLLAKALLCDKGPTPDPDGTCEDCGLVAAGEHPDVYELDAASRTGVENVREEIIGKVNYAPTRGRYKVYIIDEVHMLSTAAFNALLKTLEEPPTHVVFILCTTDPQKVPETIQSRCQRFDFRRISSEALISRLGAICELEGVHYEGDALDLIAHRANGGMRDALTSLDQLIAFGEGEVTTAVAERMLGSIDSSDLADIVRAIGERDAAACFRWTSEYMETGADLVQFVQDLTGHMRDMYVMSLAGTDVALELTEAGRRELESELAWYGSDRLARMLGVLGDLAMELKTSTNQRLSFEIALTRMVRPESDLTIASLAERVEALERALAGGRGGDSRSSASAAQGQRPRVADDAVGAGRESRAVPAGGAAEEGAAHGAAAYGENTHPSQGAPQGQRPFAADASASTAREPEAVPASAASDAAVQDIASNAQSGQGDPAAAAQSAGGSEPSRMTGVDAGRLWESVHAHLKKIGPAYGVVFMNIVPSIEDGKLTIAFSPESDFSFKAAQKDDARGALEKALARAGAEGMPYRIIRGTASAAKPAAAASGPAATAREEANVVPSERSASGHLAAATQAVGGPASSQADSSVSPHSSQNDAPGEARPVSSGAAAEAPAVGDDVAEDALAARNDAAAGAPVAQRAADVPPSSQDVAAEVPAAQDDSKSDPDFSDFLTAAFGESIVIEEIKE